MNFPIVGVGTSLSPSPSTFITIFEIKFSIVSESIGLFLVAILTDFESFSLSVFDDYARQQIIVDKKVSDQVKIIKQNFKEYLSSIMSSDLDNFYTKHNLDKSLIEFRTALEHFQKVTFDIKSNNL